MQTSDLRQALLILASSSRYRASLLQQLGLPFRQQAADIDETPLDGEDPQAYVLRLAEAKARAVAAEFPARWVIGSDQTCLLNGRIHGKPGTAENAVRQLMQAQGTGVDFLTGLCLLNLSEDICLTLCEPFRVVFRALSRQEIEHYVAVEQPLDCAGSFRVEGLGIQLFERLEGRDPNALIGLPLIGLCDLMREAGLNPLLLSGASSEQ